MATLVKQPLPPQSDYDVERVINRPFTQAEIDAHKAWVSERNRILNGLKVGNVEVPVEGDPDTFLGRVTIWCWANCWAQLYGMPRLSADKTTVLLTSRVKALGEGEE